MQRLNAIDAIAPAFARANLLLFKPFRWRTSWKIAASAYLAQVGSLFVPFPLAYLAIPLFVPSVPRAAVAILFVVSILATLFYVGIFYCCARLGLVEFEIVVTQAKKIGPMWRKYAGKVWPWIGAKVIVGLTGLVIAVPVLVHQGKGLFALGGLISSGSHSQSVDPAIMPGFVSSILGFYLAIFGVFLIPKTLSTLLDDFVLPFFLLEDLPVTKSIRRVLPLFAAEPLSFLSYLLVKFFLSLIAYMALTAAIQVILLIVMVPVALVTPLLMHAAGAVGTLLGVAIAIVFGAVGLAAFFYVSFGGYGYLMVAFDSYAAYFLGGRYPLLGSLLEPGPGGPFSPPPVFPSSQERDSPDDSGPSLPMNPAVA